MSYIENIFVCLAAPLLIAALCMAPRGRKMVIFTLSGMTVCLLSSYISTFLASIHGMSLMYASVEITPMVEEIMKFLPILFYLLVFEPKREEIADSVLMTSVGFATFENACYLINNGAANIFYLIIRGFSTGTMHVVTGFLVALGLIYLWDRIWLRAAGTIGLLSVAMTFHGIYNILVSQTGPAAYAGYIIPMITFIAGLIFSRRSYSRQE
ncbi:MAG: PrsW family intramembrane metalloprotease [Eubacterium sp.]|nr:PrsW family intramembrane metalloprotease [Eubacterium sp.]